MTEDRLLEAIAAHCHEQWAGWMRYLFEHSQEHIDGAVTIPRYLADRWRRQMDRPYDLLNADERESDRRIARGFIEIFARENAKMIEKAD